MAARVDLFETADRSSVLAAQDLEGTIAFRGRFRCFQLFDQVLCGLDRLQEFGVGGIVD